MDMDMDMDLDEVGEVIMLLYGVMEHGGPFWCYVSVKPSRFEAFRAAESAGEIDLYNFETFGEVIVSAEGEQPPRQVTERVAELHGADAQSFFQQADPLAMLQRKLEVGGAVQALREKDGGWAQRVGRRRSK